VALAASPPLAGEAAAMGSTHFKGHSEMVLDCERPFYVRDHAIHIDYTADLNADSTATADFAIIGVFVDKVHFDMKLGGSSLAPSGSTILRVMARNRLRLIWDLPNNQVLLDIIVAGKSCSAALNVTLKPGKREYTMSDGSHMYYCSAQKVLSASCEAQSN
jgi:hypothetical protein